METQPITPEEIRTDLESKVNKLVEGTIERINETLKIGKPSRENHMKIDVRGAIFWRYPFEDLRTRREAEDKVIHSYTEAGWSICEDTWGLVPPYYKTGKYEFFPGIGRG